MTLKIEIRMDNEAFGERPGDEVARILRREASMAEGSTFLPEPCSYSLRDINGNTVGKVEVTE